MCHRPISSPKFTSLVSRLTKWDVAANCARSRKGEGPRSSATSPGSWSPPPAFFSAPVAVQVLHVQAEPPAYLVAEVNVRDKAGYEKEFLPLPLKTM